MQPYFSVSRKIYSIPKAGNSESENEDACSANPGEILPFRQRSILCAISDGATQTSFSGIWANQVVKLFDRDALDLAGLKHMVSKAQVYWKQKIGELNLPWHAEVKVQQGAFATLLGIYAEKSSVSTHGGGTWRAVGIGDSCLVQTRKGNIFVQFPLTSSREFGNSPVLLASVPEKNQVFWKDTTHIFMDGLWENGDELYLMTDALAHWFYSEIEKNTNPVKTLHDKVLDNHSNKAFAAWIQGLRVDKKIKNDDTTLVWMKFTDFNLRKT